MFLTNRMVPFHGRDFILFLAVILIMKIMVEPIQTLSENNEKVINEFKDGKFIMIGPMEGKSANNNGKHLLLVDKEMNMMILNLSSFSKDGISSDQNLQLSPIKDKWSKFEIELQSFTKEQTEFGMYSHLVKSGDNAEIVVYSKVKNTNNAKFAIIKYVIGSVKVTKQDLIIDKDPKASLLSNFTVPESGATEYSLIKVSNSKGLMVEKVIVNDTAITTVNGSEMNLCSHKNSENADDKNWAKFSIADCKKDELMKWKLNTGFLNKKMMYLLTDHGLQSIPMDKFLGKSEDPFQYDSVSNENLINNKVTTPDPNSPAPNDPTDPNSILSFSSSSTSKSKVAIIIVSVIALIVIITVVVFLLFFVSK